MVLIIIKLLNFAIIYSFLKNSSDIFDKGKANSKSIANKNKNHLLQKKLFGMPLVHIFDSIDELRWLSIRNDVNYS